MTKGELIKLLQTNGHNDDTVYMGYDYDYDGIDMIQESVVKVIPAQNAIILGSKEYENSDNTKET